MEQKQASRIRLLADERGVSAIEFALIVPIIVLMAIATLDLGHGLYRSMQVQVAAEAGAQTAVARRGFDENSIVQAVTTSTNFTSIEAIPAPQEFCGCPASTGVSVIDCKLKCASGLAPGKYVTVSAQGTYNTLIPYLFLPSSYQLKAQSTVRVQ